MLIRILTFFSFLTALSFSGELFANPRDTDIEISYSVPAQKKKILFESIVQKLFPQKKEPDNYKLALALVKNVQPKDQSLLTAYLQDLASKLFEGITFTPQYSKYTPTSAGPSGQPFSRTSPLSKSSSSLALFPHVNEGVNLKGINQTLYKALLAYNRTRKTQYAFDFNTLPNNYSPYIKIASSEDIRLSRIPQDQLLRQSTPLFQKTRVDVLHETRTPIRSNLSMYTGGVTKVSKSPLKLPKKQIKAEKKIAKVEKKRTAKVSKKQEKLKRKEANRLKKKEKINKKVTPRTKPQKKIKGKQLKLPKKTLKMPKHKLHPSKQWKGPSPNIPVMALRRQR